MPHPRHRSWRRRLGGDAGFTLVEQLVTVVLLGIGVTAVLGAVLTVISTSTRHRDLSNAGVVLANVAERVASPDTPWVDCATPASYQSAAQLSADELPQDIVSPTVTVTSVRYWDGQAWSSGPCLAAAASWAQLITLRVATGNVTSEQIEVVKWNA